MSSLSIEDLKKATLDLPATWISEIVLQTPRYDEMKHWYEAVLGRAFDFEAIPKQPGQATQPDPDDKQVRASDLRGCFMGMAPEFPHDVTFAIWELPWLDKVTGRDPGLNHMQFKNADLDTLIRRVELLKQAGIHPQRSANHGPGLSFYFRDPDRNIVELCISNFDTLEESVAFLRSEAFRRNPSGIELDRDEFIARYHGGEPRETLLAI